MCERLPLFLTLLLVLCGCSDKGTPSEITKFDSRENCFNGTYLVSAGNRFGTADEKGNILLPLIFDKIEYITDEVACAYLGETIYVAGADGFFRENVPASDNLDSDTIVRIYNEALDSSFAGWKEVLEQYEILFARCSDKSCSVDEAMAQARYVEDLLMNVSGSMTSDQLERCETIRKSYREQSRKR